MLARAIALRDDSGQAIRISGSQTDITLRKQNEHKLEHAAFHDALTGLSNRILFLNRLEHLIAKVRRIGSIVGAFLFVFEKKTILTSAGIGIVGINDNSLTSDLNHA